MSDPHDPHRLPDPAQARPLNPPPAPLSQLPTPALGQQWHLADLQARAEDAWRRVRAGSLSYAEAQAEHWFHVLIGNYPVEPGSDIPALPNLGLYYWYLPPWYDDDQQPHKEDEAYQVLAGRGRLCVEGRNRELAPGDLVFVPRCAGHRFFTPYDEALSLLIIFTPPYSGAHGVVRGQEGDRCVDQAYRDRVKAERATIEERRSG